MKVWRYDLEPLRSRGVQSIAMPAGSRVVHVARREGRVGLWVLCPSIDPASGVPMVERSFLVAHTGEELPVGSVYLGTAVFPGDGLLVPLYVVHVLELAPAQQPSFTP